MRLCFPSVRVLLNVYLKTPLLVFTVVTALPSIVIVTSPLVVAFALVVESITVPFNVTVFPMYPRVLLADIYVRLLFSVMFYCLVASCIVFVTKGSTINQVCSISHTAWYLVHIA